MAPPWITRLARLGLVLSLLGTACAPAIPGEGQLSASPAAQASIEPSPTGAAAPTASAAPSSAVSDRPDPTPAEGTALIDLRLYGALLAGDDALWGVVQQGGRRSIVRLDPATNSFEPVVEDLPVLPNPIHGMAFNGSIWISSWDLGVVTQYDATTGEQIGEHQVGVHPIEPVYAFGDIWTPDHDGASLTRIDTAAGRVAATIELEPGTQPLWAEPGGGLLWVVGATSKVFGVDPESNEVRRTIDAGVGCLLHVAYVADRLWLHSCEVGGIHLFDPQDGVSLGLLDQPVGAAATLEVDGLLWLPAAADGDYIDGLAAIEPATLSVVDEFDLGLRLSEAWYTVAFDSIWINSRQGVLRVPAEALR